MPCGAKHWTLAPATQPTTCVKQWHRLADQPWRLPHKQHPGTKSGDVAVKIGKCKYQGIPTGNPWFPPVAFPWSTHPRPPPPSLVVALPCPAPESAAALVGRGLLALPSVHPCSPSLCQLFFPFILPAALCVALKLGCFLLLCCMGS